MTEKELVNRIVFSSNQGCEGKVHIKYVGKNIVYWFTEEEDDEYCSEPRVGSVKEFIDYMLPNDPDNR